MVTESPKVRQQFVYLEFSEKEKDASCLLIFWRSKLKEEDRMSQGETQLLETDYQNRRRI